ncbi:MAG TPA: Do family serine endopeptidase [Phycisphaerae bacterium]|nr:Do family serine endopeptidase [Phycisphaerae bacterium]
MKAHPKMLWSVVAAMAVATGSYFGTLTLNGSHVFAQGQSQTAKPTEQPQPEAVAPASDLSRAFRAVHNSMKDAVVNIDITKKVSGAEMGGIDMNNLPKEFRQMLPPGFQPDNGDDDGGQAQQRPQEMIQGTGSGVIVNAEGYILTNNHVVEGADTINVRLDDGRTFKAKVIGTDPKTDLAVVKIDADHLTYAKFGDSDAMQVGDWVLAFGSPFNFEQTMTQGIISAKGRNVPIIEEHDPNLTGYTYEDFLQTDAAINPGNSGGPLVNLKGEVIGINAAIASNTGAYNGIGFSIPSNEAKYIMESLIKNGKVVRGYLGVLIEDINHPSPQDKDLVQSIRDAGFKDNNGVLVAGISADSPGGKGGLRAGDVITQLDGKPVDTVNTLRNQIARTKPGTDVTLELFRDGKTTKVTFPVGTQPAGRDATQLASANGPSKAESSDLGVTVQGLQEGKARQYGLEAGQGVIITSVAPNSEAANLGLNAGDVITRVGRQDVNTPQELKDALARNPLSKGVRMIVRTSDGTERLVFAKKD